jgi:F-type H+-transporting ATPase subunit b
MRVLLPLLAAALLAFAPGLASAEPAGHDDPHAADAHGEAAADAHAGEHHGPELDTASLVRHSVNLAVLIGVLFFLLKTPISDFLKFRRTIIKEQLEASHEARGAAEARQSELEERLAGFDAELAGILDGVRQDAANERKRTLEQAEQAATQLEAAAHRTVEEELRRTRTELRDETVEQVVRMATELLGQTVQAKDRQRMAADYLAKVEEAART